ncbi:MAG: sulfatase-like hydrolase/transferase [Caldilineaceae bacterium]|nr:sulfatase-like hydrolase/transferase [Caldilineaceae bacterium]
MIRPNILLIYTDQQRWNALGTNGNPDIQTPNLDRLAAQSSNFDHYFVQNPVCMPSRASFLSGQYPSTLGITHMGVPLPPATVTLPRLLRNYGYRSANIGKLHFLPHANRDHRVPHPDYGFDELEISDEPGPYEDAYRAWIRRTQPDQLPHLSVGLPPAAAVWYKTMGIADVVPHPSATLGEGSGRFDVKGAIPFPGDDSATHSAFVAQRTMDFLRRQRRSAQPFLCVAGFYSPHSPWVVPQRFLDQYDPDQLTLPSFPPEVDARRNADAPLETLYSDAQLRSAHHGYYAMVSEVDFYVGQLLDTLDEQGLADHTIVLFTSDHGEWLGEHLRYGKGYPAHDCVSRVPLLMRVPGLAARRVEQIVEAVDVVPTLLDCTGIPTPPHLQGESLYPLLRGQTGRRRNAALTEFSGWKVLRTVNARYIAHAHGRESLFDLTAPWGEYRDLASDPAYAATLAHMRQLLITRLLEMERPLARVWPY